MPDPRQNLFRKSVIGEAHNTINAIHNWSDRKTKLFKNEYIQIAYDHLDTFYSNSEELF